MHALWHALRTFWHLAAVCGAGVATNVLLIFQKGWGDVTSWLPYAPALLLALLEIFRLRDTRQQKDKDREQGYEERMQKLYEREIAGLEKELGKVKQELKETEDDRDRLREEVRKLPQGRRGR